MRCDQLFLGLVVLQICHSCEEFAFRLYDVFPPARFVSELVSADRAKGFLTANAILITVMLSCYFGPVRNRWRSAGLFMWPWVMIELTNGIVHPAWSVYMGGYTPGTVTAVPLFIVAVLLFRCLLAASRLDGPSSRES